MEAQGKGRKAQGKMAYAKILQLLTQHRVPFKIHEHEAVRTIEDAEDKAPDLVRNLMPAKTSETFFRAY